jgi:hypothetical protein
MTSYGAAAGAFFARLMPVDLPSGRSSLDFRHVHCIDAELNDPLGMLSMVNLSIRARFWKIFF